MFTPKHLGSILRLGLQQSLLRLSASSATATSFARSAHQIPPHVLIRHTAEHVLRIRMFRALDAEAARQIEARCSAPCAALWARYARSEAVHDRYFLRDLRALGIEREQVERLRPFPATYRLGEFVCETMTAYGPLVVVLYSFWAEQNSDVGSAAVIARATELFGQQATRGAAAHRALDVGQDHSALVSTVLAGLIGDEAELSRALALLEIISDFIGRYFTELDAWGGRAAARTVLPLPTTGHLHGVS